MLTDITKKLIELAIEEDLGDGDITTDATVPEDARAIADIIAKGELVLFGHEIARYIFFKFDPAIKYSVKKKDGEACRKMDVVATIEGKAKAIISAERVALNFMQHLSGIATLAKKFVDKTDGTTKILDTRKTAPGMRAIEKMAVKCAGAANHRKGLFDAYLIKENHIAAAGSIENAVRLVRSKNNNSLPIEVEVRNFDELDEAIQNKVDIIMLDNFTPSDAAKAVRFANGKAKIEISGGIDLQNISDYLSARPDFISIGEMTHSAKAADLSLIVQDIL